MNHRTKHIFQIGRRELIINEKSILWTKKLLNNVISEPTEIRYGAQPIEFDMFTIGTRYRIDLKDAKGRTLTIPIKSYLGIGRNEKINQYEEIADVIWELFFAERCGTIVSQWEQGQTQQVGKFEIDSKGISRSQKRKVRMDFEEMELFPRYDHLLINSRLRVDKYIKLYYLEDWNWPMVQEILHRAKEIGT